MKEKNKIKNENYITIQGFMVNELKLKGNELLIYAIIYGFNQTDDTQYTGSLQYLANWTNSSKQGIQKNLKSLLDKGFIIKSEEKINNIKYCYYKTTYGMQQSCIVYNKVSWGMQQSCNNNILNNKENNNISNDILLQKKKKFVAPSLEEVKQYCEERNNNIDPQYFIDFYESKDWYVGKNKMKDWKASIRTWEKNNTKKQIKRNLSFDELCKKYEGK